MREPFCRARSMKTRAPRNSSKGDAELGRWGLKLYLHCAPQNMRLLASLVAQWLRICLLMQGTRVRALVWEDPTCHGAAGPVGHNY